MAVPQRKKSRARRNNRRAQQSRVTLPQACICDNCGEDIISHRACPACGWYRGRIAVPVEEPEEFEEFEEFEEAV